MSGLSPNPINLYFGGIIRYAAVATYKLIRCHNTSRHVVVCRAAQETQGAQQTSVYFTGAKKMPFSHIYSLNMNFSVQILSRLAFVSFSQKFLQLLELVHAVIDCLEIWSTITAYILSVSMIQFL